MLITLRAKSRNSLKKSDLETDKYKVKNQNRIEKKRIGPKWQVVGHQILEISRKKQLQQEVLTMLRKKCQLK